MKNNSQIQNRCPVCENEKDIFYLDNYRLHIDEDIFFFNNIKLFKCNICETGFACPMPELENLSEFYRNTYRSSDRPPWWTSKIYDNKYVSYLEDKNLSLLQYLTTFININEIENIFDFGAGYGDLGFVLKKKKPSISLDCSENDKECEKILIERGYNNFKNIEGTNSKYDLILAIHSLEHLTNTKIFINFKKLLKPKGLIFFEVPNSSQEYFRKRIYDSPHLIFFTKKSFEKIGLKYNLRLINITTSSYSMSDSFKFQKQSQNLYKKLNNGIFKFKYIKNFIKRITPKIFLQFRRDYLKLKKINDDFRLNHFINNSYDSWCVRGIFQKND